MSEFFRNIEQRLADYEQRLARGEPREQAWSDAWLIDPRIDAVPMTKAETIMRREEALKMRWPLFSVAQVALLMCEVPESELFYGGSPNGSMSDDLASAFYLDRLRVPQ